MDIFEWLYSIEDRMVWEIGSNSLHDLQLALYGYASALRSFDPNAGDPMYPGFQRFVEDHYDMKDTPLGWPEIINGHEPDTGAALKTFYTLLRKYRNSLPFSWC